jgi:hypothetical protein
MSAKPLKAEIKQGNGIHDGPLWTRRANGKIKIWQEFIDWANA